MSATTLTNFRLSSEQSMNVNNAIANALQRSRDQAVADALRIPYMIDHVDLEELRKLFPGREIIGGTREQQHPILRFLNDYYNNLLRGYAATARKAGLRTCSIGGHDLDKPFYDHVCTKIKSIYDYNRYSKNVHCSRSILMGKGNTCNNGCEVCLEPADVAYAVDACYDIEPVQIMKTFVNKGLNEMYFTLLLPDCIMNPEALSVEGDIRNNLYYYVEITTVKGRQKLRFCTKDGNPHYEHDLINLKNYLLCTAYYLRNFTITFEIIEKRGICYLFRAVKTNYMSNFVRKYSGCIKNTLHTEDEFARSITCDDSTKGFVILPNMLLRYSEDYDVLNRVAKRWNYWSNIVYEEPTGIPVPMSLIVLLVSYTNAITFEKFTPNDFATYLKSKISAIQFDDKVIRKGWDLTETQYQAVFITTYIYCRIIKNELKLAVSDIQKLVSFEDTAYPRLMSCFIRFKTWLLRNTTTSHYVNQKILPSQFISNMIFHKVVKSTVSYGIYMDVDCDINDVIWVTYPVTSEDAEEDEAPPVHASMPSSSSPSATTSATTVPSAPSAPNAASSASSTTTLSSSGTVVAPDGSTLSPSLFKPKIRRKYKIVSKAFNTCITLTDMFYDGDLPYYVNASNLDLHLGGGTSAALATLCGPKLQNDMNVVATGKTKDVISGNTYLTNNSYLNGIKGVFHVCVDRNKVHDSTYMAKVWLNLSNAIIASRIPPNQIGTCLIGAGIFGGDPQVAFDHYLNCMPGGVLHGVPKGIKLNGNWIDERDCDLKSYTDVPADGHCLLHCVAKITQLNKSQVAAAWITAGLPIQDSLGNNLMQYHEVLDRVADSLKFHIWLHDDNNGTLFEYGTYGSAHRGCIYQLGAHYVVGNCDHGKVYGGSVKGFKSKVPLALQKVQEVVFADDEAEKKIFEAAFKKMGKPVWVRVRSQGVGNINGDFDTGVDIVSSKKLAKTKPKSIISKPLVDFKQNSINNDEDTANPIINKSKALTFADVKQSASNFVSKSLNKYKSYRPSNDKPAANDNNVESKNNDKSVDNKQDSKKHVDKNKGGESIDNKQNSLKHVDNIEGECVDNKQDTIKHVDKLQESEGGGKLQSPIKLAVKKNGKRNKIAKNIKEVSKIDEVGAKAIQQDNSQDKPGANNTKQDNSQGKTDKNLDGSSNADAESKLAATKSVRFVVDSENQQQNIENKEIDSDRAEQLELRDSLAPLRDLNKIKSIPVVKAKNNDDHLDNISDIFDIDYKLGMHKNILNIDVTGLCFYFTKNLQLPIMKSVTFNTGVDENNIKVIDKIARVIPLYDKFIDISCAPGGLSTNLVEMKKEVQFGYYVGDNNMELRQKFNNVVKYKKLTDEVLAKFDFSGNALCILDVPFGNDVATFRNLVDYTERINCDLLIKDRIWAMDTDDSIKQFRQMVQNVGNRGCFAFKSIKSASSEFYVLISSKINKVTNEKVVLDVIRKALYDNNIVLPETAVGKNTNEKYDHTIPATGKEVEELVLSWIKSDIPIIAKLGAELNSKHSNIWLHKNGKLREKIETNTKVLLGVPGSGKSKDLPTYCVKKQGIIVTTTTSNKENTKRNAHKPVVYTPHTGLYKIITGQMRKPIFIDECQEFPRAYYAILRSFAKEIECYGDAEQIGHVDFEKDLSTDQNVDYTGIPYSKTESIRIPTDIARFWRSKDKDIVSAGSVKRSIFGTNDVKTLSSCAFTIAPTNDTKLKYGCDQTIHECKGGTYSVVGIVVESAEDYQLLANTTRWFYVATTRHTNAIVIVEPDSSSKIFNIMHAGIHSILDQVTSPHTTFQVIDPKVLVKSKKDDIVASGVNTNVITDMLDRNLPKANPDVSDNINADMLVAPTIPNVQQGKIRLNIEMLEPEESKVRIGKGVISRNVYTKNYNVGDVKTGVQTLIKRYARMTSSGYGDMTTMRDINSVVELYWRGLLKWTKCKNIQELQDAFYVDDDTYNTECKEYLIRLQAKLTAAQSITNRKEKSKMLRAIEKDEDITLTDKNVADILNTTWDEVNKSIDFFMKHQSKYIDKPGWDAMFKAGQGVSAVTKTMNIIMAAASRCALQSLQKVLRDNVKMTIGESPINYKHWYVDTLKNLNPQKMNSFTIDATEWDASNRADNIFFDASIFYCQRIHPSKRQMGDMIITRVDKPGVSTFGFIKNKLQGVKNYYYTTNWCIDVFIKARMEWRMVYLTPKGLAILNGEQKKHSGEQYTIGGNTINNMAQTGAMIEFDGACEKNDLGITLVDNTNEPGCVGPALFQGDDSAIIGFIKIIKPVREFFEKMGWKFKITESDQHICEYVGFIMHKDGWMPDLMKRVSKTISKNYTSYEQFEESAVGLQDTMSIVENQAELELGLAASLVYYKEYTNLRVTSAELETTFHYLKGITKERWSDLRSRSSNLVYL